MNGKPLAELRTEIELGLNVYQVPDGYCGIYRDRSDNLYVYAACDDTTWETWEELIAAFGEDALWSTFDAYERHPSIEEIVDLLKGDQWTF